MVGSIPTSGDAHNEPLCANALALDFAALHSGWHKAGHDEIADW